MLFIFHAFTKKSFTILQPNKPFKDIPASLKPRTGSLNSSVFFDFDSPEKQSLPKQPKQALKKVVESLTTLPEQKALEETKNSQEGSTEKAEPHKIKAGETPTPMKKEIKEVKIEVEKEKAHKKLTEEELRRLALQNLLKRPLEELEAKNKVDKLQQNKPSLLEMVASKLGAPAKQLSTHVPMGVPGLMKSKGFDLAERKGDDTKKPTFEDLKYVCYLRKIAGCLAEGVGNIAQRFQASGRGKIEILFEIGKSGNLDGTEVLRTSDKYLEALLHNVVKTSAPYPPIPKYFKKEYFFSKIEISYDQTPTYRSMEATLYALV